MAARCAFAYDTGLVYTGLPMKVVSLVVEGLEQAQEAGLFDWIQEEDADLVCLQDTRCSEYSLKGDVYFPENYSPYFLDDFDNIADGYDKPFAVRALQYEGRFWSQPGSNTHHCRHREIDQAFGG